MNSKYLWLVLALLAVAPRSADARHPLAQPNDRPNFVFILADDLGYGDLGCYGREDIRTPRLDQLAREGVRFTAHYANGAECTPTRAAFLTGRYQQRIGGLECAIGTGNVGRYEEAVRLRETHDLGLPVSQQTIVGLLKQAGYRTAISGKWHLGYEPQFAPHLHGFDFTFYCIGGGMDYFHYLDTAAGYNLFQDGRPIHGEGYFTDLMTDQAIAFIERQTGDSPFFLYVPYTAPHSPFQGPDDWQQDPLPLDSPLWNQGQAPPAVYIAMIEHMDRRIGDLLDVLERRGFSDNTLVVFAGDNGGTASARNAPFSGIKGSTYEGGIRVPAIVRWPGKIPAGIESSQPCLTFDFTASIARLASVQPKPDLPFDGIDIVQHIVQELPTAERTLFWRKPRGQTIWHGAREGNWKYVAQTKGDHFRASLFNLERDPGERNDLQATHRTRFEQLQQKYRRWEIEVRRGARGTVPVD
jgi:N-acetylgalactosamine-6-sulfatase